MEKILNEIDKLIKDCFFEKYCDIEWHGDARMEDKIMHREMKDLQWEVEDLIKSRLEDLDTDIEIWQEENEEDWCKKEMQADVDDRKTRDYLERSLFE